MPDLLPSLEPSNVLRILFFFFLTAFYFSKSISLPSFLPFAIIIPLFFSLRKLSCQLDVLNILHSSQSPPFFSSLTWLLPRPATQLSSGIFLYYFTRLVLLLPGSHIFSLGPFSFFREGNSFLLLGSCGEPVENFNSYDFRFYVVPIKPHIWLLPSIALTSLSREPLCHSARRMESHSIGAHSKLRLHVPASSVLISHSLSFFH